jgi:predicted AAA+ superfamily ATPase
MYPIKTHKKKMQKLFVSMLRRAEELRNQPEFYNTITQNCTTSILDHANELREDKIPWSIEALLPSHSDKVIYDLGLIDTELSLEEARNYYQINELSEQF